MLTNGRTAIELWPAVSGRSHVAFAERWLTVKVPKQCQNDQQRSHGEQSLAARRAGIELHPLAGDIKRPGQHYGDRKTEQCDQDKNAQRPRRRVESRESDGGRLHREPRHNEIGCADLEYLAPL